MPISDQEIVHFYFITPAAHVRNAIKVLRPGRPEDQCTLRLMLWGMRLSRALRNLNLALAAANARRDSACKARVMRMANWVRAERRRVAKQEAL